MASGAEHEDNGWDEILSTVARPYRPAFAETESSFFYKCEDCGDCYFLESSLKIHHSRESVAITYFCKKCNKNLVYNNKCNLKAHMRKHPVNDGEEITLIIRPLPLFCEDGHFRENSSDVIVLEESREDVNGLNVAKEGVKTVGSSSKCPVSSNDKRGFIELSKLEENPQRFPQSNLKLISTNAKSGEVKVIIRPQPQPSTYLPDKTVICRECRLRVKNIRSHFLGENKPLNSDWRCQICDLILPAKCSFKAHIRIHSKKEPFICPDCMKEFGLYELFMVHLKYFCFHLDKYPRFVCQACPGAFPSITNLEVHLASKHVKPVYKCRACPMVFFEVSLLNEHKLQSHGERLVPTEFFEQCSRLFLHVHEHVTSQNSCFYSYKCSFCGFITKEKFAFATHRLSCSDGENDVNALALAKVSRDKMLIDAFDDGNSGAKVKTGLTICLPASPSTSSGLNFNSTVGFSDRSNKNSNAHLPNGKMKSIMAATSATEIKGSSLSNSIFNSSSTYGNPHHIVSKGRDECNKAISPQRVYKGCGWHPHKCLMCRNELAVGTLRAWQNIPDSYEGCHKWKLGDTHDSSVSSSKILSPGVSIRKSHRRNCIALNGPSYESKICTPSSAQGTYLCHICKHSLQIDHRIIQKHFRQQHHDVEIMSLKPVVHKFNFNKSKVPLELLRFSVKPSKMLQVMVDKRKADATRSKSKKGLPKVKEKCDQTGTRSLIILKSWLKCTECSFRSRNKKLYQKHMKSHKSKCYICHECKLEFVSEPSYKIHLVMNHGIDDERKMMKSDARDNANEVVVQDSDGDPGTGMLKCRVCQKSFSQLNDLRKHFRVHGMALLMLNKDETVWRKV
ncbi:zinc finger protein 532-like [Hetaerina americana]|uniref:zinc finger protein 532-like n=1 Tax=Hetaerina americana TaxID=62018 RepID=UPI003A7F3C75